jgi:hypothetical protein
MVEYCHRLKIDSFSSDPKRSRSRIIYWRLQMTGGQITWLSNKQTWETDWIIKPWVNLACCLLRRSPIGIQDRFVWQQHLPVAKNNLNCVFRLYQWRLPVAEKDPQLVTRLYQQHLPVAKKILNWVMRLCTSSIQQLLKRYSIGLQYCTTRHCWYDGCSQVQWNYYYYYYYYIWQEYPLPFSQQLPFPAKMYVSKHSKKNRPVQSIKGLYTNPPLSIVSGQCMCVYKYIQI